MNTKPLYIKFDIEYRGNFIGYGHTISVLNCTSKITYFLNHIGKSVTWIDKNLIRQISPLRLSLLVLPAPLLLVPSFLFFISTHYCHHIWIWCLYQYLLYIRSSSATNIKMLQSHLSPSVPPLPPFVKHLLLLILMLFLMIKWTYFDVVSLFTLQHHLLFFLLPLVWCFLFFYFCWYRLIVVVIIEGIVVVRGSVGNNNDGKDSNSCLE